MSITKQDLKEALSVHKTELKSELKSELKTELSVEFDKKLETRLAAQTKELKSYTDQKLKKHDKQLKGFVVQKLKSALKQQTDEIGELITDQVGYIREDLEIIKNEQTKLRGDIDECKIKVHKLEQHPNLKL